MRAAVLYEPRKPMVIEEVTLDEPKSGEVLVRIAATGVCHSDYHVIDGSWHGDAFPLPVVLGHEASAIVKATGPNVSLVKPGDRVILSFKPTCGRCRFCHGGEPFLCSGTDSVPGTLTDNTRRLHLRGLELNHFAKTASFAEYAVVHESQAIPIRPEMPLDRAALIGCAVMTGVGAVLNTARVEQGSTIAVFATGGIGLNIIQGGTLVNARQIIAVDLLDNKLQYARAVGATHTINSRVNDPVEAIREITGGLGVDYAFDAIGLPVVSRQAYDSTRRGGTTVVVGMAPTGAEILIPGTIAGSAKTVKGCFYGSPRPALDFPRLVDFYLSGQLKLDQIISRRYKFEEINDAFDALAHGDNARGVVVLASEE